MARKFKRKQVKRVRTSYTYKPKSTLSDTEKRVYRSVFLTFVIVIAIAVGLYVWGTDLIFSIDNLWREHNPDSQVINSNTDDTVLVPPTVDPVALFTHKDKIDITGWSQSGKEVAIFANDNEIAKVLVDSNWHFEYAGIELKEGENKIYAKAVDGDKYSDKSEVVTVTLDTVKPELEYTIGEIDQEKAQVEITGKTTGADRLFINDRRVILAKDGSFSYTFHLKDGKNKLHFSAEDLADNKLEKDDVVTFEAPKTDSAEVTPESKETQDQTQ